MMFNDDVQNHATASGVTDASTDVPDRSASKNRLLSLFKPRRNLRIANWNVRTTTNRLNLLVDELLKFKIDIALISEARIPGYGDMMVDSSEAVPTYKCFYSGGVNREYGVAILLKKELCDAVIQFEAISDRLCFIELKGTINLTAVATYAPTNQHTEATKDAFYNSLQAVFDRIPKRNATIIGGDMNAETGSDRSGWESILGPFGRGSFNDNSLRLLTFASHNSLLLANSWFKHKPCHKITWISNAGNVYKELDHFLVSKRFRSSFKDVRVRRGACIGSDHHMLLAKVSLRLQSCIKRNSTSPPLDYSSLRDLTVAQQFQLKLENRFSALEVEEVNVEDAWTNISETITSSLKDVCPKRKRRKKPWISNNTLALVEERRQAVVENNKPRRNKLNKQISKALIADETAWFNHKASIMEEAAINGNSRVLYDTLRSLTGQRSTVSEDIKDINGSFIVGKAAKLERWANYFEDLLNRPDPVQLDNDLFTDDNLDEEISLIAVHPPSKNEIDVAIKKLKSNKSPGVDTIPPEAFKFGGNVLRKRIHNLLLLIWEQEDVPKNWRNSVLVPVFKKGSKHMCQNYRGISLIDIASKIITSIIRSRISAVYESNLREEQAGFRQGRGCSDQIFALRQVFERRLRHGKEFGCLFVDFSAAFDSVHRESLWAAMSALGIPAKIIGILKSLYKKSQSWVRVYGELSRSFEIKTGVKQGCIISPCLFNIILDWVLVKAMKGCKGLLVGNDLSITDLGYADDLAYLGESEADLQHFLNNLDKYGKMIGLQISVKKTKLMSNIGASLNLNNQPIEAVDSFVYLGSTFEIQQLRCTKDVITRIGKASSAFGRLKSPLFTRPDISLSTKMKVFNSSIIPVLLYGAESWIIGVEELRKLEVTQMAWLRCILQVTLNDRIRNDEIRRRCCNQPDVASMIRKARLRWFGHVSRMQRDRIPKKIFDSIRPDDWKCPKSAPKLSWKQLVLKDVALGGLTNRYFNDPIAEASDMAQVRAQWRAFIRDITFASNNHEDGFLL